MKQPSVLMLSYAFPPVAASGTFRVARFVRYLPELGWRPIVLAPKPEHATYNKVDSSLMQLVPSDTIVVHTSVLRPSVWTKRWTRKLLHRRKRLEEPPESKESPEAEAPKGPPVAAAVARWRSAARDVRRCLFEMPDRNVGWVLPAVCAGLRLVRRHRPKVVYSTGPPHSAHLAAVLLKSITGLPTVCDLRDPWARNPWQADDGTLHAKAQSWTERLCVRRSDAVILNTEAAREEFESSYRGRRRGRFVAIPNGYDPDLVPRIAALSSERGQVGSNSTIRLCHCGSVYGNRSLLPLIEAVAKLTASGRQLELSQVGAVARLSELLTYIHHHGLEERVVILGQLPHEQALASMAGADLLVVLQSGTQVQIPGKVFEMMLFAKPILALTDEGPTADLVRDYALGIVADPSDPEAIAGAIVTLSDRPREFLEDNRRTEAVRTFDGLRLTGKLAELLREHAC